MYMYIVDWFRTCDLQNFLAYFYAMQIAPPGPWTKVIGHNSSGQGLIQHVQHAMCALRPYR